MYARLSMLRKEIEQKVTKKRQMHLPVDGALEE